MAGRNLFASLCVGAVLMALPACSPATNGTAAQPSTNASPDLLKAVHDRDEAVDKVDAAT